MFGRRKRDSRELPSRRGARGDASGGEARYRSLFENIPVGLYITSPDGRLLDANPELVRMLGSSSREALLAHSAHELYVRPQDRLVELGLLARDGGVRRFETQLRRCDTRSGRHPMRATWRAEQDGETIWVLDTCRAIRDASGAIIRYEGSLEDITEERTLREQMQHMARHDPVTGAFNRYALEEILAGEVARARRYHHPIGLLMVDIDRFKAFNDRFGHGAGDDVLRSVADLLTKCVRETDVVVRYGGDEFLILLVETGGEATRVKERIEREALRQFGATAYGVPIHVSIGAAHWSPETGESIDTLFSRADRAMYEDKPSRPQSAEAADPDPHTRLDRTEAGAARPPA